MNLKEDISINITDIIKITVQQYEKFMTANFSIQMKWIISEKNKLNKISTRINNLNSLVSKVTEYINKNVSPTKKLQVCIASPIKVYIFIF